MSGNNIYDKSVRGLKSSINNLYDRGLIEPWMREDLETMVTRMVEHADDLDRQVDALVMEKSNLEERVRELKQEQSQDASLQARVEDYIEDLEETLSRFKQDIAGRL